MQSFNTKSFTVGPVDSIPVGSCITYALPNGNELAIFNVNGEFHAIGNFCPHRGAPLSEGFLCGHIVECALHGWQFDVRTGECLTVPEPVESYEVIVEDGWIKLSVS